MDSKNFTLFYLYQLGVISSIPSLFTDRERAPIPTGWEGGWACPTVGLDAVANRKISACIKKLTLYFFSTHSCIHVPAAMFSDSHLIMKPTYNMVIQHLNEVFAYINACKKTSLDIHFIYLHNKEICCIFKTCCIISVLFSIKCYSFHNFYHFLFKNTHFFHKSCAKI